jgi:hypothetical protein
MRRPPRRLILRCYLCHPDGLFVEPTSERAVYAAADHALDEHLDQLAADWESTLAQLRVTA